MKQVKAVLRANFALVLGIIFLNVPTSAQQVNDANDDVCSCLLDVIAESELYPDSVVDRCRGILVAYLKPRISSEDSTARFEEQKVEIRKLAEACYDEAGLSWDEEEEPELTRGSKRVLLKVGALILVAMLIPLALSISKRKQGKQNRLLQEALNAIEAKPEGEFPAKELIDTYEMRMPAGLLERVKTGRKKLQIDLYTTAMTYSMEGQSATLDFKDIVFGKFQPVQDGKRIDLYLSLEFQSAKVHVEANDEQSAEQFISWLSWLLIRDVNRPLRGEKGAYFKDDFVEALQTLAGTE